MFEHKRSAMVKILLLTPAEVAMVQIHLGLTQRYYLGHTLWKGGITALYSIFPLDVDTKYPWTVVIRNSERFLSVLIAAVYLSSKI